MEDDKKITLGALLAYLVIWLLRIIAVLVLWNYAVVDIFSLPCISFIQSLCLVTIVDVFLKK